MPGPEYPITDKLWIRQFRYGNDNFSYLLYTFKDAMVVDGGATSELLAFMRTTGLRLVYIANTHSHSDHTVGNSVMRRETEGELLDGRWLAAHPVLRFSGQPVKVYRTPGHTVDSVCFHAGGVLITGDTLFNGTVGNCFSGDLRSFYDSLQLLANLPDSTRIYAGHDYVQDSLAFARKLEPQNAAIDQYRERYHPEHVFSTLHEERQVNPYLRFNEDDIIAFLRKRSMPVGTAFERWRSLMSVE
jgi:hydroxyacylglutathione hydrolase